MWSKRIAAQLIAIAMIAAPVASLGYTYHVRGTWQYSPTQYHDHQVYGWAVVDFYACGNTCVGYHPELSATAYSHENYGATSGIFTPTLARDPADQSCFNVALLPSGSTLHCGMKMTGRTEDAHSTICIDGECVTHSGKSGSYIDWIDVFPIPAAIPFSMDFVNTRLAIGSHTSSGEIHWWRITAPGRVERHGFPSGAASHTFATAGITVDFTSGPGGELSALSVAGDAPLTTWNMFNAKLPRYWEVRSALAGAFEADVTIAYDSAEVPPGVAESSLVLLVWNATEGYWEDVPNSFVDVNLHTITGEGLTEFSVLAIAEPPISTGMETGDLAPADVSVAVAPNPFNPRTTIRFALPQGGQVGLRVYDIAGRLIRTLLDVDLPAGSHQAVWDGKDASGRGMPSGSYFARLSTGGKVETVRMGLVR